MAKEKRDSAFQILNQALISERERRWSAKKPELSDDPAAAELQQPLDMPKSMAEDAMKERRRRVMTDVPPGSDKVH